MNCNNGCCKLIIETYIDDKFYKVNGTNIQEKKAGVLIHNSCNNKILLIQSKGNFWGFPKGTMEKGEDVRSCALRELYEETGIKLTSKILGECKCICVHNKALY